MHLVWIFLLLVVPAFRASEETFETNIGRPAKYKDGNPLEIFAEVAKVVDAVGSVVGSMISDLDPLKNKGDKENGEKNFEFFHPRGISRIFKKIFNLDKHCDKDKKLPPESDNDTPRDATGQTHSQSESTENVSHTTETDKSSPLTEQ